MTQTSSGAHAVAGCVDVVRTCMRELTPREAGILILLMDGASNKLIARELKIAESTVKVHVKSLLRKLHVKNRTQAAMVAVGDRRISEIGAAPAANRKVPASRIEAASDVVLLMELFAKRPEDVFADVEPEEIVGVLWVLYGFFRRAGEYADRSLERLVNGPALKPVPEVRVAVSEILLKEPPRPAALEAYKREFQLPNGHG